MPHQMKRGTAAEWAAATGRPRIGEPGYITDTDQVIVGDGLTHPSDLLSLLPNSGTFRISDTTAGVAAATISIAIPDRDDLVAVRIFGRGRSNGAVANAHAYLRLNASTAAVYGYQRISVISTGVSTEEFVNSNLAGVCTIPGASATDANMWGTFIVEIPFPDFFGSWRMGSSRGGCQWDNATTANRIAMTYEHHYRRQRRIATVDFSISSGSWLAGTRFTAWGVIAK